MAPHRTELADRAEQATLEAAERHPDAGPGRLLELLAAERPAMLEGLSRELVERAGATAVAAYRQAAAGVGERAAGRVQRLQAEAASTFGVPLPACSATRLPWPAASPPPSSAAAGCWPRPKIGASGGPSSWSGPPTYSTR